MNQYTVEVSRGERFEFGKNWNRFLDLLNDERISDAEDSLRVALEMENLEGKRFLDIGSGSGLFSLAARRLGARVHSFDFDPQSVACTSELRQRYFPNDAEWTIEQESALNDTYLKSLGEFDIVYTWGVLHHTGAMWQALENAQLPVASAGKLVIAIYNDMGSQSARWKRIKQIYNKLPKFLRTPFTIVALVPSEGKAFLHSVLMLRPRRYIERWTHYDRTRGMSAWRDAVDWVGGYPYEVARPEEIFEFYKARGFRLLKLKTGGVGLGCNEFVFTKDS